MSAYGEVTKRFPISTELDNVNPNLSLKIELHRLKYRFMKILELFHNKKGKDWVLSGVGRKFGAGEDTWNDSGSAKVSEVLQVYRARNTGIEGES